MDKLIFDILREYSYPEWMYDDIISKLQNLSPKIRKHFESWLSNRTEPDIDIEGYTYKSLLNDYKMTPINAFITLNWLQLNPDEAKIALQGMIDDIKI